MARPHIEFVQCQNIPWADVGGGVQVKRLNADPDSTAATLIQRCSPGWTSSVGAQDAYAQELFVLDGALDVDGRRYGRHSYLFRPGGGVPRGGV